MDSIAIRRWDIKQRYMRDMTLTGIISPKLSKTLENLISERIRMQSDISSQRENPAYLPALNSDYATASGVMSLFGLVIGVHNAGDLSKAIDETTEPERITPPTEEPPTVTVGDAWAEFEALIRGNNQIIKIIPMGLPKLPTLQEVVAHYSPETDTDRATEGELRGIVGELLGNVIGRG